MGAAIQKKTKRPPTPSFFENELKDLKIYNKIKYLRDGKNHQKNA